MLPVSGTRALDLTLHVDAIESTVEVRDATEELARSNAAVGDVLVSSQLDNLPVNGREWRALSALPASINVNGLLSPASYKTQVWHASGVSLIPADGQTLDHGVNIAASATPAKGTWGNAGRSLVRGPNPFQIDSALATFGRITSLLNSTPIGTGGCSSIQLSLRLAF